VDAAGLIPGGNTLCPVTRARTWLSVIARPALWRGDFARPCSSYLPQRKKHSPGLALVGRTLRTVRTDGGQNPMHQCVRALWHLAPRLLGLLPSARVLGPEHAVAASIPFRASFFFT
jgi:hypothetical protein